MLYWLVITRKTSVTITAMLVSHIGKRSKAPEKKPPGQKPPDNKLPRIIEKIVAKYDFDANLF